MSESNRIFSKISLYIYVLTPLPVSTRGEILQLGQLTAVVHNTDYHCKRFSWLFPATKIPSTGSVYFRLGPLSLSNWPIAERRSIRFRTAAGKYDVLL